MTNILAAVMATFDDVGDERAREVLNQSIALVLKHIETAGMVVVQVSPMLASDFASFEDAVLSHLTPTDEATKAAELDASDVNGEAVIHDLRSKGWFILPPK